MSTSDDPLIHQARKQVDEIFGDMKKWPPGTGWSSHEYHHSDIIIATFPKSGTTLLQNMSYSLACLTGGGPENDPRGEHFSDIELVAPWIEFAPEMGVEVGASDPRVYKTHRSVGDVRLGMCKFVVVVRDPRKVISSWLNFLYDWILAERARDEVMVRREAFQELARRRLLGRNWAGGKVEGRFGTWFEWVRGWMAEEGESVLLLFYEDVVADLAGTVRQVAKLMGREAGDEVVREVVRRCGREEMARQERFGCVEWAKAMGLPKGGMKAVMPGRGGFHQFELDESTQEKVKVMMRAAFGVDTYDEMREMVKKKQMASRECAAKG
eukprot:GFKZ01000142.1.p1 GENE.GFKZ01000142.1~~GFKZ01000142.1.p1  ORF type:complete len:325 (+),score=51.77 GFKZ01000142.1:108-1082(+)